MKKTVIIFALLALLAVDVSAQFFESGYWLYNRWRHYAQMKSLAIEMLETPSFRLAGQFEGFVLGVGQMADMQGLITGLLEVPGWKMYEVVGKYLGEHPELWNKGAAWIVVQALQAVWPTKQ